MAGIGLERETGKPVEGSSPTKAVAESSTPAIPPPPLTPDTSKRFTSVIKYFRSSKTRSTTISTTWPSRRFISKNSAKPPSEESSRNKIPEALRLTTPTTSKSPDLDLFRSPSLPVPAAVLEPGLRQNIELERRFLEYQEPRETSHRKSSLPFLEPGVADSVPKNPLRTEVPFVKAFFESPLVPSSNNKKADTSSPPTESVLKAMASNNPIGGQYDSFQEQNAGPSTTTGNQTAQSPLPNGQNSSSTPTNLSGLVCNVHRTTGREPRPLVGPSSTVLGDKLYVFGGRVQSRSRPELLTNEMYELDLVRRHWTKLETTGDIPPPRYFHTVCALGDSKLVCYGGMSAKAALPNQPPATPNKTSQRSGEEAQQGVVLLSDVHIFDVPSRTWVFIPTANAPRGRYAHCATILPSRATFGSSNAPISALHHNPSSSNPHQGTLGVEIDGYGGAEMIVVGGQDTSNHYFEEINVFNLRSLKWTSTTSLDRSCGAYRSVATPLLGVKPSNIGGGVEVEGFRDPTKPDAQKPDPLLLIYSNYNFLDVKLNLQLRTSDGKLTEKSMNGTVSPPGLRFPNGGIINGHFVVSGTYLTSSKQEYAMWALDLKTLTWGRIDAGGAIFSHGSWNRGVLWSRRSTFVVIGHRKRSLVEDYNHRRINFSHICFVELEAFGLYENPRRSAPTSGYVSVSSPMVPASLQAKISQQGAGGRPLSTTAEELGRMALSLRELSDMELLTIGGERIPVNSHILARRWGPYFIQLLRESTIAEENMSDAATVRQQTSSHPSRNSSITITPSVGNNSSYSAATTLIGHTGASSNQRTPPSLLPNLEIPSAHTLTPTSRPRTLYLPHTHLTVQLLVHYLYTSSLPPPGSQLCTPQILCSLLQLARPYQVDGLLEATVERLHQVLDGRNAAAVFNAAAMAAGSGRGTGFASGPGGTLEVLNGVHSRSNAVASAIEPMSILNLNSNSDTESGDTSGPRSGTVGGGPGQSQRGTPSAQRPANLRINTTNLNTGNAPGGFSAGGNRNRAESVSSAASTATSASTNTSLSFSESMGVDDIARHNDPNNKNKDDDMVGHERGRSKPEREIWTGEISSVVGLQKRGLRGLMEGRRMRERGGRPANPPGAAGVGGEDGNSTDTGGAPPAISAAPAGVAVGSG
ncbi:regulatory protein Ral2 [Histoplasma capsulatum]|uniref:Regulatory protein Ral2 n=2 Tax=Histoplasma TaxID=5036 RepID=A0A8A1MIW5_AJECA|nr:regulatory protein Ral2 [Histoplasma capsulatum]